MIKVGYILMTDDGQYVESYDIAKKTVDISSARTDAKVFQKKEVADHTAEELERMGCFVRLV
jgi:hypothetical protein